MSLEGTVPDLKPISFDLQLWHSAAPSEKMNETSVCYLQVRTFVNAVGDLRIGRTSRMASR